MRTTHITENLKKIGVQILAFIKGEGKVCTDVVCAEIEMARDFAEASAIYSKDRKYRQNSNCYTYALGIPKHGVAVPGMLTNKFMNKKNRFGRENIRLQPIFAALIADGLLLVPRPDKHNYGDVPIIAAFISKEDDYHFYRLHKDGFWSHQAGHKGVIIGQDEAGNFISDPLKADRGRYRDFVGYFAVPKSGLTYSVFDL